MKKTIFITGASTGFGKLTAKLFQKKGWNVVATMRSPEKETELTALENVKVLRLDVTDVETIKAATTEAVEAFGQIDVLVNNAGYGAMGMFETASTKEIRYQMDVNYFGVVDVTQAILPYMRERKQGKIINVTSIGGTMGFAAVSLYNASKFAVEGLSEGLRMELKNFNIDVQLIEPGGFATEFVNNTTFNKGREVESLTAYQEIYYKFIGRLFSAPPKPFGFGDPQVVANKIYDCATGKSKTFRNFVGKDAKMMTFLKSWLPEKMVFKMLHDTMVSKTDPYKV